MTLVTQAAYARHCGVSEPRVTRWKQRGTVVMVGDKVDQQASDALRARVNYRGGEVGGSRSAAAKAQDTAAANGNGGLPEPTQQGMAASLAAKEFYLSKLREAEYDEKLGSLVDVSAVVEEVAAVFAVVRNLLLGLPAKLAPRIIHCETSQAAKALLQEQIEQILRELSSEPDDDQEVA